MMEGIKHVGANTEQKRQKRKFCLEFWNYDDGSINYVLRERTKMLQLEEGECRTEVAFKKAKIALKRRLEPYTEFEIKKIKLIKRCGLQAFAEDDCLKLSPEQGRVGLEELKKLISCCGEESEKQAEVLRLVGGIMAGYCSRLIRENDDDGYFGLMNWRAPILKVKGNFQTFDMLEKIVNSLAFDVSVSDDKVEFQNPRILPPRRAVYEIRQCAYFQIKQQKRMFRPIYRDTAVLLHGFFFKNGDVLDFARRNPWVSVVAFNCKIQDFGMSTMSLDGKILEKAVLNWDSKRVRELMRGFLHYLAELEDEEGEFSDRLPKKIIEAENRLFYIAPNLPEKLTPSLKKMYVQVMVTLRLFLDFCVVEKVLLGDERSLIWGKCCNLLLSGYNLSVENMPTAAPLPQKISQAKVEEILTRMTAEENAERFLRVEADNIHDRVDPNNPSFQYWGYLRLYNQKSDLPYRVLIIRKSDFVELAPKFCTGLKDPKAHWGDFCKKSSNAPNYLRKRKARMPDGVSENRAEDALVMEIEKMNFLPEAQRKALLSKFKE